MEFVACAKCLTVHARTLWDQTDYQSVPNIPKWRTRQGQCDCACQAVVWVNTTSWPALPQNISLPSSYSYYLQLRGKSRPGPVLFLLPGQVLLLVTVLIQVLVNKAQPSPLWSEQGTSCHPAIQSFSYSRLNRTILCSASSYSMTINDPFWCQCVYLDSLE